MALLIFPVLNLKVGVSGKEFKQRSLSSNRFCLLYQIQLSSVSLFAYLRKRGEEIRAGNEDLKVQVSDG